MQIAQALSTSQPVTSIEPIPQAWTAKVFERLAGQLGGKMADLYAGVPASVVQQEWGMGLAGYQAEEISRGLAACRLRAFAPTLGEFLTMCRPINDPEIAWLEAAEGMRQRDRGGKGEWSHPALFRAACQMAYELRTESYAKCKKRWAWELSREIRLGWGDPVPEPQERLENKVTLGPPSDEVRRRINELLGKK